MARKRKPSNKMYRALERLKRGDKLYYHTENAAFMRLSPSGERFNKPTINALFDRMLIEYRPEFDGACSGYIVLTESGKKLLGESAYVAAAQPAHSVKQST